MLKPKRFEETINHYVMLYNHEIPQKALGDEPPIQAMKTWYGKCPALFRKPVYNLTGHDMFCCPSSCIPPKESHYEKIVDIST